MIKPNISRYARIRVQLGRTQQQLANSLNISLSLLKMIETGKRKLPAKALPFMQEMEAIAQSMPATISEPLPQKPGGFQRMNCYNRVPNTRRSSAPLPAARTAIALEFPGSTVFTVTDTRITGNRVPDVQQELDPLLNQQQKIDGQLRLLELEKQQAINHTATINAFLTGTRLCIERYSQLIADTTNENSAHTYLGRKLKEELKAIKLRRQLIHFDAASINIKSFAITALRNELSSLERQINRKKRSLLELAGKLRAMQGWKEEAA